jgi:hypothetical protein
MKRIILSALFIVFATLSYGQSLRWGVVGGVNFSSTTYQSSHVGMSAGVKAEYGLPSVAKGSYLDIELLLSEKGFKDENGSQSYNETDKESRYYLVLPLHYGFKFNAGKSVKLFASAGPYIACGLFGKEKLTTTGDPSTFSPSQTPYEVSNVFSDNLKRFDWGVGFKVGMEFMKHLQLQTGFDWGLKDPSTGNERTGENKNFFISLGVMF